MTNQEYFMNDCKSCKYLLGTDGRVALYNKDDQCTYCTKNTKMTNSEKYHDTWCRICAFAAIGETLTECNLRQIYVQHACVLCDCYNKEAHHCHCHDEATNSYTCRYYKENGR